MSRSDGMKNPVKKAVALQYGPDDTAPVIVASGMGYMAEKIVETAADNGVPIYEDNSLSTILTQLQLGQEIPPSLYQAIVEIYVYFLRFDPSGKKDGGGNAP
ncbi:MAG: type III secretion protein [Oscillibacter sp.]|nr:type III secretion protein [Oscillibacter sp.]